MESMLAALNSWLERPGALLSARREGREFEPRRPRQYLKEPISKEMGSFVNERTLEAELGTSGVIGPVLTVQREALC